MEDKNESNPDFAGDLDDENYNDNEIKSSAVNPEPTNKLLVNKNADSADQGQSDSDSMSSDPDSDPEHPDLNVAESLEILRRMLSTLLIGVDRSKLNLIKNCVRKAATRSNFSLIYRADKIKAMHGYFECYVSLRHKATGKVVEMAKAVHRYKSTSHQLAFMEVLRIFESDNFQVNEVIGRKPTHVGDVEVIPHTFVPEMETNNHRTGFRKIARGFDSQCQNNESLEQFQKEISKLKTLGTQRLVNLQKADDCDNLNAKALQGAAKKLGFQLHDEVETDSKIPHPNSHYTAHLLLSKYSYITELSIAQGANELSAKNAAFDKAVHMLCDSKVFRLLKRDSTGQIPIIVGYEPNNDQSGIVSETKLGREPSADMVENVQLMKTKLLPLLKSNFYAIKTAALRKSINAAAKASDLKVVFENKNQKKSKLYIGSLWLQKGALLIEVSQASSAKKKKPLTFVLRSLLEKLCHETITIVSRDGRLHLEGEGLPQYQRCEEQNETGMSEILCNFRLTIIAELQYCGTIFLLFRCNNPAILLIACWEKKLDESLFRKYTNPVRNFCKQKLRPLPILF